MTASVQIMLCGPSPPQKKKKQEENKTLIIENITSVVYAYSGLL